MEVIQSPRIGKFSIKVWRYFLSKTIIKKIWGSTVTFLLAEINNNINLIV